MSIKLTRMVELADVLAGIESDIRAEINILDTSVTECDCCARQNWNDRDEYQIARSLSSLANKAKGIADICREVAHRLEIN